MIFRASYSLTALMAVGAIPHAIAQSQIPPKPHVAHHFSKKPSTPSVAEQISQMRQEMQSQIDALKQQLNERDARVSSMQQSMDKLQQQASEAATQAQAVNSSVAQNNGMVSSLRSAVDEVKASDTSLAAQLSSTKDAVESTHKELEQPTALHYKGVTITPGGFFSMDTVWRQRAMNADIYTNWNGIPYPGAGEAHTSEFVPSARQSRPSLLVSGKVPFGTLRGFLEADFLSAGSTSNNLQTNSYTLRVRQAWAQAVFGNTTFTGGQTWSLLTEDRKRSEPGLEALPLFFDGNYHVGFTYARQAGFRLQQAFTPRFAVAASIENSQYQFSASNAPTNFFFGAPGVAAGLNNPSANYTNQLAPDILVKATYDPGSAHYEVGGVLRFFRDRYYPGGTTASGAQNDTEIGGGFVASARFPVTHFADVGVHIVGGDGTGRYGASLLPDITVRPNGTLEPLRNGQGMASLELHPTARFDIFGYGGTEYVQRTYYRSATGTLVGYAPPTASDTGCEVEAVPTAGTGYAPGTGTCVGATRDIIQGTIGWVYRVYSGPMGKLQYGAAYSYLVKHGWTGVGGAPEATNNFVYTSFRYYLP